MRSNTILVAGLVCVDVINLMTDFPLEDTDQRLLHMQKRVGGNASNNCTVLSMLHSQCDFFGVLGDDEHSTFIKKHFDFLKVGHNQCVQMRGITTPCTTVLLNSTNGSRTMLSYRGRLRELTADDLRTNVNLMNYAWVHLEGRKGVEELLDVVIQHNKHYPEKRVILSVELEKPMRTDLHAILQMEVDYIFFSKDYCMHHNLSNKEVAVDTLADWKKFDGTIVCPWGTDGAAAKRKDCEMVTSPIFPPDEVVDTLGAGDCFIASTIHALSNGMMLGDSIRFGCEFAGRKVGRDGILEQKSHRILARLDTLRYRNRIL